MFSRTCLCFQGVWKETSGINWVKVRREIGTKWVITNVTDFRIIKRLIYEIVGKVEMKHSR